MFGSKEVTEEKLVTLVKKGKWDTIKKSYLNASPAVQVKLASACTQSNSDDSVNILISLLEAQELEVKLAAVQAIGEIGTDHVVSQLQHLYAQQGSGDGELKTALQNALNKIRNKK